MSGIPHASCGLLDPCPADLPTAVKVANANGFDFLVTPVVHPKYRVRETVSELSTLPNGDVETEANDVITRQSPFTRSGKCSIVPSRRIEIYPQILNF